VEVERDHDPRLNLSQAKVSLPQYRRKLFDSRMVYFTVLALVLCAGLALVEWRVGGRTNGVPAHTSWSAGQQREFANKLREFLPRAAAEQYETYLAMTSTTPHERAGVYYTVAKTAIDVNDFETALAYFYKAEVAEPDGPLASEIGSGIVRCLEELGKFIDAQSALDARAGLDSGGPAGETAVRGTVVGRIGSRAITVAELDRALQQLPPWAQQQYANPGKKAEFLNQYIAEQLLYEKALKLELDKDAQVRKQVAEATRRAAVNKLIERDVRDKVKVNPEDVRMFYDAHVDEFTDKARARVRHILVEEENDARDVLAQLATGTSFEDLAKERSLDVASRDSGGDVRGWVTADGTVPGVESSEPMVEAILATDAGKSTAPIEDDAGWHIFYIEEKQPARQRPFDEVKNVAERRYRALKEQEEYRRLIDTTLEANDVEVFPEQLGAGS